MGEDDDGSRSRPAFKVVFEPFKLIRPEKAEATGLQIHDVDQTDKVHAVGVERVPAVAFGGLAITVAVKFPVRIEKVVLAGDVMHVEAGLRNNPVGVVELRFQRQVTDVAGVDHEGRFLR